MDLGGYLVIARRWWWTLLVATCVSALIGYLVASRIPPTYEAQAQLLVGPINTDVDTLRASSQLAQTYAQLVISQPLLESTSKEFGGAVDPTKLAQNVRSSASDVTRILVIRVDDSDPSRAAQIANTMANELIQLTSAGTTRPEGQMQLTSSAQAPTAPIAPQVSLIVLLAALAGLLGALVLVILAESLSDSLKDVSELPKIIDAPLLAQIEVPVGAADATKPLVEAAPGSAPAIAFRQLAAKILGRDGGANVRRIVIVALQEGDSGIVAANVGAAAAMSGYRTLVVDGAVEGRLTQTLGLDGERGVAELARGGNVDSVGVYEIGPGLLAVPRGDGTLQGLGRTRVASMLRRFEADSDVVVVDGGGVDNSPVALDWVSGGESVVLVIALGSHPKRNQIRLADESVRLVGASLTGVVLLTGRAPSRSGRRRARRDARPRPVPTNLGQAGGPAYPGASLAAAPAGAEAEPDRPAPAARAFVTASGAPETGRRNVSARRQSE